MTTKNELEGFPREVIEKMLERQVEQGNEISKNVFMENADSTKKMGGFDWHDTIEHDWFWESVIHNKNFDFFFKKYPKEKSEAWQPKRGEWVLVWNGIEESATKRIYISTIEGLHEPFMVVNRHTEKEFLNGKNFEVCGFVNIKPLPTEPVVDNTYFFDGFKNKVIELIENLIEERNENIRNNIKAEFYSVAHTNKAKKMEAELILKLIKELN
jgi:hypothetical protein